MAVVQVKPALALSLGAALALSACEGDADRAKYFLEGSLGQVMDLGYDQMRILIAPEDVSLLFVRVRKLSAIPSADGGLGENTEAGTSEDYPLRVSYRYVDIGLPAGGRVDLTERDPDGNQRGVISRNVQGDARTAFPEIHIGTISFSRPIELGETIEGDFHVTFVNGVEAASGRTAFTKSYTAKVSP